LVSCERIIVRKTWLSQPTPHAKHVFTRRPACYRVLHRPTEIATQRGHVDGCKGNHEMNEQPLETWHRLVRTQDPSGLDSLLGEDAVFYSPVVHAPQRGKALATAYLTAAFTIFVNPTFRYVREIVGTSDAMLEFETEMDGIIVNGVDLIKWNGAGKIVEFKVMLRPLKAINLVHQRMAAMLQSRQEAS
jgi:hypothetical protein